MPFFWPFWQSPAIKSVWGMNGLLLIYTHKVSFPRRAEKILLSKDQLLLLLELDDTDWESQCVAAMTTRTVLHKLKQLIDFRSPDCMLYISADLYPRQTLCFRMVSRLPLFLVYTREDTIFVYKSWFITVQCLEEFFVIVCSGEMLHHICAEFCPLIISVS